MGTTAEYAAWLNQQAEYRQNWATGNSVGSKLPSASGVQKLQLLQTRLDQPMPLVYGRHLVAGAPILQDKDVSDNTAWFLALGEGPWDGIEYAWLDGALLSLPDTSLLHFHPGLDGQTGTETTPGTENQKLCSFFPAGFTSLTFSRTAYTSLFFALDPAWPGPEHDFRAIYRTRRVRLFDADGVETSFAYSINPAWQMLDAFIALKLKPHGAADEALTDEEKARIDFSSFVDSAAVCDYDIGGGVKRFASHVAFLDQTTLATVFETLMALCRGYLQERSGRLTLSIDQPRSSVFLFDRDQIQEHSIQFPEKDMRSLANRVVVKARDEESGGGTPSNDFAPFSKTIDDEAHQDLIGRTIKKEMDLGANTRERSERLGRYWLKRSLLSGQARLMATPDAGALMPGDIVEAPRDQRTWLESAIDPDWITMAGFSTSTASQAVDGNVFSQAWTLDNAGASGTATIDFGAGNAQEIIRAKLYCGSAGRSRACTHTLEYSDNGSDWTVAATFEWPLSFLNVRSWATAGAHRYWRFAGTSDPFETETSTIITEIALYEPLGAWEVIEATDGPPPGHDREFFLQEYDPAIFSDTADAQQDVEETNVE